MSTTPSLAHLTTTQHSAYGDLIARGSLRPSSRAFSRWDGRRTYSRRTLQALVDTGVAEWRKAVRMTRAVGPVTYDGFITPIVTPEPEEAPTSRGYAIGVPLVVTVHGDGRVEFEVDLTEVPLDETEPEYTDEQVEADQSVLDAVLARMKYSHTFE